MVKLNELKKGTKKLIDRLKWETSVYIPDFTEEELKEINSDFEKFGFSDLYIDGEYYLMGLLDEIEETKNWWTWDEETEDWV